MKKIIFWIIFVIFSSFLNVNAWYYYPYVCNDSWCFTTQEWELSKNSNKYFLIVDNKIDNKSFKSIIDEKLKNLEKYYWNTKFVIKDFYDKDKDKIFDWELNISTLINYDKKIYIAESSLLFWTKIKQEYDNWLDYLFSNFENVINNLHKNNFPYWDKNNNIDYFLENIVYYSDYDKNFYVKNVCDTSECRESKFYKIPYNNTNLLTYINWKVKPAKDFILNTFVVSKDYKLSSLFMKAWWKVSATFWFEDYLDFSKEFTSYKYIISYNYQWENIVDELEETIKISKDFKLYSDNIKPDLLTKMFKLEVLNYKTKHIRLNINEEFTRTKAWEITFYLTVENLNTKDKFERKAINENVKLRVLPIDKIWTATANIYWFNKEINESWYNVNDTFWISISLKDIYWNIHYDQIDWYEITFTEGSSQNIELSNQWSDKFLKSIFVKSDNDDNKLINFKIRINKSGYHKFNWFNIKFKNKSNDYYYSNPIIVQTFDKIIPNVLQNRNIYIKQPEKSDFNISCTNNKVIIESKCTSDNFSWCNSSQNKKLIFDKESDNWKKWVITIQDYAYNTRSFNYSINHIDKTSPKFEIYNWSEELINSNFLLANDNQLKIISYEKTAWSCLPRQNVLVKLDWVEIYNKQLTQSSEEIKIDNVFKKTWKRNLYIKISDNYNNFTEKNYILNISPNYPDMSKSLLTLLNPGEKFADNIDWYNYKLELKDKFWNPINNKKVNLINQSCNWYNWCKTLYLDMVNESWDTSFLLNTVNNSILNSNWELNFTLKSLSPGEFTNRFIINMNLWDNKYINIPTNKDYYISNNTDTKFKELFYWELFSSRDWHEWWNKVEVWTKLNYKLEVKGFKSTYNNINTEIENFKDKILPFDEINTYITWKSDLSWLNTKNINFSLSINNKSKSLWTPWIKVMWRWPEISYQILWKTIRYFLWEKSSTNWFSISNQWDKIQDKFIWVRVIWNLQSSWNQEITWQNKNFSDISKTDLRTQIRKNAFEYIKNMKNNTIVWNVRYVVWDITISWEISGYETLIVKDWNVIINWNLNTNKRNFWIIVLKDWFDLKNDYKTSWNIYIDKNVTKINALIYADWWFVSSNWKFIYDEDTIARSKDLQKQLFINWSLFTRNTIAWAIWVEWNYYLPWGWKTSDFNLSMIYDLNYLRRWNKDCDTDLNWNCFYSDATIIKYDIKNNPKLFSK